MAIRVSGSEGVFGCYVGVRISTPKFCYGLQFSPDRAVRATGLFCLNLGGHVGKERDAISIRANKSLAS